MARNRVIYNEQALFVGPSPATGAHFITQNGVLTGSIGANMLTNTGLLYEILRTQSVSLDANVGNLLNVNQLGELADIDFVSVSNPSVTLNGSYLLSNFINEQNIGLTLCNNGLVGCLSGILSTAEISKNYFVWVRSQGLDAHNGAQISQAEYVKALGNGRLTNYQFQAQVGQLPTVNFTVEALNETVQSFDLTTVTSLTLPALSPSGTPVIGNFAVPNPNIYNSNFAITADSWTGRLLTGAAPFVGGLLSGNIDSINGFNDTLAFTPTGSGIHSIYFQNMLVSGGSYNVQGRTYIPTTNISSNNAAFFVNQGGAGLQRLNPLAASSSWQSFNFSFNNTGYGEPTTPGGYVPFANDLNFSTFSGVGLTSTYPVVGSAVSDVVYLRDIVVTNNNFNSQFGGLTTNMYGLPTNSSLQSISVLHPGDIQVTLNYPDMGPQISDLKIQSVNLQIPLQSQGIEKLGQRISTNRNVQFPIQATLSIDAVVGNMQTGSLYDLAVNCSGKKYDARIDIISPCGQSGVASYICKGMSLQNITDNLQIGSNESATLNFLIPIGSATALTTNVFLSGIGWNKPV